MTGTNTEDFAFTPKRYFQEVDKNAHFLFASVIGFVTELMVDVKVKFICCNFPLRFFKDRMILAIKFLR